MRAPARATKPQPRLRLWIALLAAGCAVTRGSPPIPAVAPGAARAPAESSDARLRPIRAYIKTAWHSLERTHRDLGLAARDEKVPHNEGEPWPVYFPAAEDPAKIEAALTTEMAPASRNQIVLRPLTANPPPGLLYLPRPYVVPGGRFNEMYGWDSYFIVLGLLRDGEIELARDMTDNFLYEVENYGRVLNANRTYYLTRSQPPFLTEMVLAVYGATADRDWLARAFPAVQAYYQFWVKEPHLVLPSGLSRYFDLGEGPAPEVVAGERDKRGKNHYDRVRDYYRTHTITDYRSEDFYDRARDELTPLYYRGDRSMRESGFDPSNRFGPFGADIVHYLPVCLNAHCSPSRAYAATASMKNPAARHLLVCAPSWTGKTHSICPRPNSPCAPTWPAASRCGSSAGPTTSSTKRCWPRARAPRPSPTCCTTDRPTRPAASTTARC
jgi:alpha,alpha-trehalase